MDWIKVTLTFEIKYVIMYFYNRGTEYKLTITGTPISGHTMLCDGGTGLFHTTTTLLR